MADNVFVGYSTANAKSPADVRHYGIDLVKRDLKNNFMTKKGERPMQPTFGSVIWDLLFEPFDNTIKDRIIADSKIIINADPRVSFVDMTVTEYEHGLSLAFLLDFVPYNVRESLYVEFIK